METHFAANSKQPVSTKEGDRALHNDLDRVLFSTVIYYCCLRLKLSRKNCFLPQTICKWKVAVLS